MQRESMTIVTLWKDGRPRPCHSEKEIEAATADGFVPYNPKDHEYPRMLYRGTEDLKCGTAEAEKALAKEGWRRTPGEEYVPQGTSGDGKTAIATSPRTDDLTGLLALMANLEERLQALEAKKGKKKPEDTE